MKNRKKATITVILAGVVLIIAGIVIYTCYHRWNDATCTEPRTCSICGKTEGEPLGHKWNSATCVKPQICKVCKETKGKALGHDPETWLTVTEPTCTAEG